MSTTISDSCANGLTHFGMLAGVMKVGGSPGQYNLDLGGKPAIGLGEIERVLGANGVSGMLRALPFGRQSLNQFAELSLLSGLLATIKRTLHVDFREPQAATRLTQELQRVGTGGSFSGAAPAMPRFNSSLSSNLLRLGSASLAFKDRLGIDLFGPNGKRELETMLSNPSTIRVRSELGLPSIPVSTMNGLSKLAKVSSGVHGLRSELGWDMLKGGSPLRPSSLAHLRSGHLASLWAALAAGSINTHLKLPDPNLVAKMSAQKAGLQIMGLATGLKPSDPSFAPELSSLLRSFEASGVCSVVHAHPIDGTQLDGLKRVSSFNSGVNAVAGGLGVHALDPDAGPKLAHAVEMLRGQDKPPVGGSGNWADVIPALKRLADIGTALG